MYVASEFINIFQNNFKYCNFNFSQRLVFSAGVVCGFLWVEYPVPVQMPTMYTCDGKQDGTALCLCVRSSRPRCLPRADCRQRMSLSVLSAYRCRRGEEPREAKYSLQTQGREWREVGELVVAGYPRCPCSQFEGESPNIQ